MPARTIAIGDIHGCAQALARLLEVLQPTQSDTIVTLGDYVDRGPDSRGVLDLLVDLLGRCELVPLLGNHEVMLLEASASREAMAFWQACGGQETLESYGGSLKNVPQDHWVFLQSLSRHHESAEHIFVHANYDPNLLLHQQPDRLLLWEHIDRKVPPRHESGKIAIVGHTPQVSGEVLDLGSLICIDTYCVGGGWLTALDVHNGTLWQVDRTGALRERS